MTDTIRHLARLTDREHQVLAMAADGLSNAEIGAQIHVSEDTIKTHVRRLFRKLGARNRAHAVHLGHVAKLLCTRPADSTPDDRQASSPSAAEPATQGRPTHVLRVVDLSDPRKATQTPLVARSALDAEAQLRKAAGQVPTNRRVLLYRVGDLGRPVARMQGFRVL